MRKLFFLIALFLSLPLAAQVYKYTDEKGVIHYTDKPPSKNAKPANLPQLHTYEALPSASSETAKPKSPADQPKSVFYELKISSPAPDTTFRDSTSEVGVSVEVVPSMPSDYSLAFFVDGVAQTDKTGSTSTTLGGLERGQHSIEAVLYNDKGFEVARSPAVNVFMHQPTVKKKAAPPRPAPR